MAVVTVPIFYSLYFPIYEASKEFYSKLIYQNKNTFNSYVYTLSSVSAAITCDLITNPMWVVRIRYQTEYIISGKQKMDSFNVPKSIYKLYKREGFFALYRGLAASLLGVPHVVIQFNMYEHLKKYGALKYKTNTDNLPLHYIFAISVYSKILASLCTYPHEVIRNNLQNERKYEQKQMSFTKLVQEIYKERGLKGFYSGFQINLMRILPNTAIMFVAYEYLSKLLNNTLHNAKDD